MYRSSFRRLVTRTVSGVGVMALALGMGSVAFAETPTPTPTAADEASLVTTTPSPLSEIAELFNDEATPGLEETPVVEEAPAVEETPVVEVTPEARESASAAPSAEPEVKLPAESTEDEATVEAPVATADQWLAGDAKAEAGAVMPMAVGPDGGTAPYVYWDVRDTDGNLVSGATFQFEARVQSSSRPSSWSWNTGNNASAINDCDGTCSTNNDGDSLDRDADGGEWLLEHRGTNPNGNNRIAAGSNYRVSQVTAPAGYKWAVTGKNTKTINTANSNAGTWNNGNGTNTHNFGSFAVEKIATAPMCTAGYIYSVQSSGQMKQIAPNRTVTDMGSVPSTGGTFNGLGIGYGGQPVFAYARSGTENSDSKVSIYKYDVTTGTWTDTNHNVDSNTGNPSRSVTFVAGAVNLDTGRYFLGGYSGDGANRVFRLWEYNPATNASVYKGYISATGDGVANGDIAFDAQGNLFVIRGAGSTTTIYSVTAANLAAANGGLITSAPSTAVSGTTSNVNGVAFDSSGKGFLGSGGTLQSYNMPGWSGQSTVTSGLVNSTDLASCGSPPTITIEKEIIGGRVNTNDQFHLTLNQGSTLLGEATTTGTAIGVQGERVGPLPTVRNVALNFAESGANGANLNNYASAYQCTVTYTDGTVENLQQVNGASGSITIPTTGDAVRCVFRNSPLVANVTINKQVTDALGLNPQPDSGWTVGATTTATTGTATQAPTAATQTTNVAGNADWKVTFGAYAHRATVTVSETVTSKPGYQFLSGQCVVTGLDGSTATTELTGPNATALTGVKPGDQVNCSYVNKPIPGALAITKAFDSSVPSGSGNIEFTGAYSCVLPAGSSTVVASGTWTRDGEGPATLTPAVGTPAANQIPAGASCSATENQPTGSTGLPNSSYEWDTYSVSDPVTIVANQTGTVTVTNKAKRVYGNFSVTKVVPEGSVVAEGMKFGGNWTCTLGTAPNVETKTGTWGPVAPGATWTSTDAAQIPLGANCTATETDRAANPVTDGSHVWDGDPVVTPENGVAATNEATVNLITVTNKTKPVPGAVTWEKVDDALLAAHLEGSEWKIVGPDPATTEVPVTDCVADDAAGCATATDTDHRAGYFKVTGLAWGSYQLVETKAPAGHYPIEDPLDFVIDSGSLEPSLGKIVNPRIDGPVLPLTGGIGRDAFFIAGLSVLVLGLGAVGATRIRNRRREVA
ncbi:hypothetical protein SAMN02745244_03183 [Tessaracoccus bendigoensis DSM 12906]|uniref:Uncharacterized protein n=1 Tax=Tessaracoccus bendigoensis DSM 12906 TaxID=1123357 RepID=A0A1M6LWA4_9ACTN|nr:hypothetical protein SAMN02745244_03183 [Tessaracoccus bendigoensis DSM 12906]